MFSPPKHTAHDLQPSPEEEAALASAGLVRIPLETGLNVGPVNVTLVLGERPALIDTAMHHADNLDQLEQTLRAHRLSLSDIQEIWLTHPHIDHFGLTGAIQARSPARVYALQQGAYRFANYVKYWQSDREAFVQQMETVGAPDSLLAEIRATQSSFPHVASPFAVDVPLQADQPATLAGRHRVLPIHVPGHTPWCTAFWLPDAQILVAGDLLRQQMRFNMILYPAHDAPPAHQGLACFQTSLQRAHDLPATWTIPGHGVAFRDHQSTIRRALKRQHKRMDLIVAQLQDDGPMTAYDLAVQMYSPTITHEALLLVMCDTLAMLHALHQHHRISSQSIDTTVVWKATSD